MVDQKKRNPNHPVKGSQIKVLPIRELKDINAIKKMLKHEKPRDYCLFVLGINTNLRASDLLSIEVGQVEDLSVGDELELKERKTGKSRRITVNESVVEAVQHYLKDVEVEDHEALFTGQRGPLTVPSINRLV